MCVHATKKTFPIETKKKGKEEKKRKKNDARKKVDQRRLKEVGKKGREEINK